MKNFRRFNSETINKRIENKVYKLKSKIKVLYFKDPHLRHYPSSIYENNVLKDFIKYISEIINGLIIENFP